MAKRTYKILRFDGGINNDADARDIGDNQLAECTDMVVHNMGRMGMLGGYTSAHSNFSTTLNHGYGLFPFSADRNGGDGGDGATGTDGDYTNYLAMWGNDDACVDIFEEGASIGTTKIDLGGTTGDPCFYYADGALRVCNGDLSDGSTNKWYGYINRERFEPATMGETINGWYSLDQSLTPPVGAANLSKHEDTTPPIAYTNPAVGTPVAAQQLCLEVDVLRRPNLAEEETASFGWRGFKQYHYSFIYDDNQESLPTAFGATGEGAWEGSKKRFKVGLKGPFNKRISGAKIYWQSVSSDWVAYGDMYLLLIVDFANGVRKQSVSDWIPFTDHNTGASATLCESNDWITFNNEPLTAIYEVESGVSHTLRTLDIKYKTAVMANRMLYVGNVKHMGADGVTKTYADRMVKSMPNQFDKFDSQFRQIDVAIKDGSEIIKLEEFADRILQFKNDAMYLINVTQPNAEFLESTHKHKGISHPSASCKTDFGIAWVNIHGCYFYDGQKVENLLEAEGMRKLDEGVWEAFATTPMVGYFPKKRQIIVANNDGAIFLYDMVTKSWVKGANATLPSSSTKRTNFATDWNNDLIFGHTSGTMVKFTDTAASGTISVKTKDIDFGEPAVRKKLYKVYITHKGTGTRPTVTYHTNGGTAEYDFTGSLASSPVWTRGELVPDTAIEAKSIYSCQLKFAGSTGSDFEINDISFVYRTKGIK
mgnify:FL=1|tara:strand:+ start:450 stop:2570 length:2121 start_codon:yes stop_codon:yes gene_type:complete